MSELLTKRRTVDLCRLDSSLCRTRWPGVGPAARLANDAVFVRACRPW